MWPANCKDMLNDEVCLQCNSNLHGWRFLHSSSVFRTNTSIRLSHLVAPLPAYLELGSEVLCTSPVFRTPGIDNFPWIHEALLMDAFAVCGKCWIVSQGTPPAACCTDCFEGINFPCFHNCLSLTTLNLNWNQLACRLVSRGTPPAIDPFLAELWLPITYKRKLSITIYPRFYHGPCGSGDASWRYRMVPCDALCAILRCVCICAAFHAVHWRFDERNCSAETSLTWSLTFAVYSVVRLEENYLCSSLQYNG